MTRNNLDDVWGDDDDESDAQELDRNWNARRDEHHNTGYRLGLDKGKQQTLQAGFNQGFKEGTLGGLPWGKVRGAISTLQAVSAHVPEVAELLAKIEALGERLAETEQQSAVDSFQLLQLSESAGVPSRFSEEEHGEVFRLLEQLGIASEARSILVEDQGQASSQSTEIAYEEEEHPS